MPLLLRVVPALFVAVSAAAQQLATPPPAAQTLPAPQTQSPPPDAGAAPQQPGQPTTTIRVNSSLVILDMVVVDKAGNAVTDLQKSDFIVTDDSQPETIRDFELPGRFTPAPDITIDSTADLDRLAPRAPVNIVLLDEFNTRFEDMAFARYSLARWLKSQPAKLDTPVMLIAVNLQHFTVLHDYTQNKDEILSALDHHFAAYPWQAHNGGWTAERYSTAHLTLRRVAEAVVGHPGHKNMIWLGRGFPTMMASRISPDDQGHLHSVMQVTVDKLRDARITLYTIDPAGVMTNPGEYGTAAQLFAPFGGDPDFQQLARATGGRNLYGRNDVDAEIGTSIRDGASLYTLTYRPQSVEEERSKFHAIKVTVDRPGLTVVTRQGYYPDRQPPRPNSDGSVGKNLNRELGSAVNSNMEYDGVAFTVQADAADQNDLKFHVDPKSVPWYIYSDGRQRNTRVIVVVTSFDKKNKEVQQDGRRFEFKAPPNAPATGALNIAVGFEVKVKPEPKATHARLVVRMEASGRMGTADLTLGPGAEAHSSRSAPAPAQPAAPAPAPNTDTPAPPTTPPGATP